MIKRKRFTVTLTPEDLLDVTLDIEKKTIVKFALNYRTLVEGDYKEVYRVDNFHGFLHEQRFWRSPEPIPLEQDIPLYVIIEEYYKQILSSFKKYKEYYNEKIKTRKDSKTA